MSPMQTEQLLKLMAAFDHREINDGDADAWQKVIGDLDFRQAADAVIDHYKISSERMMPVHVRRGVAALEA